MLRRNENAGHRVGAVGAQTEPREDPAFLATVFATWLAHTV